MYSDCQDQEGQLMDDSENPQNVYKDTTTEEPEPYDYSQDWSDYDWWGYDGVLESALKKRSSIRNGQLKFNDMRSSSSKLQTNRRRRRLGSMR